MRYLALSCLVAVVTLAIGLMLVWWTNNTPALPADQPVEVWVADPMQNVLPSDRAPKRAPRQIELHALRNEWECAQVVLRSNRRFEGLTVQLSALTSSRGSVAKEHCRWFVVGYVPVRKNTPRTPSSELVGIAPGAFPDPLLEKPFFSLLPGRAQPLYVLFFIPPETPAGDYEGVLQLGQAEVALAEIPIRLTVYAATLPDRRSFGFTCWFSPDDLAKQHGVALWSDDFWRLLPAYARNLYEHRQTMILTPMDLIKVHRATNGNLTFDFRQFDRWINLFFAAGVTMIEGKAMGRRVGKWTSPEMKFDRIAVSDPLARKPLPNEVVLRAFLRAVERHLASRGLLDRFVIHVADEPTRYNYRSWRNLSRFIHSAAPRLRRIEANQTPELDNEIEISVPQLDSLGQAMNRYKEKQQKFGNELWFYTCMYPTGSFANRFIDYPLIKTRLLPWIAARYGLTGYLHWGYNYWSKRPFEDVERSGLPPGDSFIVYPGQDGPLSSLRWEMLREGIEDYECLRLLSEQHGARESGSAGEWAPLFPPLLSQLTKKNVPLTQTLAGRIVYAPDRYNLSLPEFNTLHRQIRQMLGNMLQE